MIVADTNVIALAQQLDINLVTSDQKLLKAFPDNAVSLESDAS